MPLVARKRLTSPRRFCCFLPCFLTLKSPQVVAVNFSPPLAQKPCQKLELRPRGNSTNLMSDEMSVVSANKIKAIFILFLQ